MIAGGARNICVDLSKLDYLYSDTINALISLNKGMLDVVGRLALLSPQPPVVEILKKSGVYNILKVFANEIEVLRVSEEVLSQAASGATATKKGPASEFDDLRAEIGSALGEGFAATPQTAIPPRVPSAKPAGPQFAKPGVPATPAKPPEPPAPPVRPYTPPQPKPAIAAGTVAEPATQQPTAGGADEFDAFEAKLQEKAPAASAARPTESAGKKSPIGVILGAIVLVILAAGGYLLYTSVKTGKEPLLMSTPAEKPVAAEKPASIEKPIAEAVPAPEPVATPAAVPAAATDEAPAQTAKAVAAPAEQPTEVAQSEPAPEPRPAVEKRSKAHRHEAAKKKSAAEHKAAAKAAAREKSEPAPEAQSARAEEAKAAPAPVKAVAPAPEAQPAPVAAAEPKTAPIKKSVESAPAQARSADASIFIASVPICADVYVDGKLIGTTNSELKVPTGSHSVRFVKGAKELTRQMRFRSGRNPTTWVRLIDQQ